jgi:glyoxylase-like metal-dependent hydrolase (beta-lactamase superfamily II)
MSISNKNHFQQGNKRNRKEDGEDMIEEIASDFYRIEIPLPETLLKSVNSYVIRDSERNLIIDTGMYNDECFNAMQKALKKLHIDLNKTDFFITHSHGDHLGLVPRLIHDGSVVYIDEMEANVISRIISGVIFSDIRGLLLLSGFPEKDPEKILPPHIGHEFKSRDALPFRFIREGDIVERGGFHFTCVSTPGHSRGHMCLYEPHKNFLIAGDHILKDITPGIQGRADNQNTLKEYLSSLDKVSTLDIDTVLPGHRDLFGNCKNRIEEIKEHHQQRNREVLAILHAGGKNIYEVASQMTWNVDCDSWDSFPVVQSFFAMGEAFAHLRYLEEDGEIKREMEGQTAIYSLRSP